MSYLKFDSIDTSFGFIENLVDECVCLKTSGSQYIFLTLYIDDIVLASSNMCLLNDTKKFLSKYFDTKDLGEASYIYAGNRNQQRQKRRLLGLSQQNYISKVLKCFYLEMF